MSKQLERFYEVEDSTIRTFNDVQSKMSFPIKINFKVIGDTKLKKLIEIKKYSPEEEYAFGYQIKVKINEDLLNNMGDDNAVEILLKEGLNCIEPNSETGVIKLKKHDFSTFESMLEKYKDDMRRAKDLERLTLQQTEERKQEQEF